MESGDREPRETPAVTRASVTPSRPGAAIEAIAQRLQGRTETLREEQDMTVRDTPIDTRTYNLTEEARSRSEKRREERERTHEEMADDDEVELVRRPRRGGGLAVITREYLQESPEVRVTIAGAPDETLGLSTIEERDRDYSIDGDELEVESRIVQKYHARYYYVIIKQGR